MEVSDSRRIPYLIRQQGDEGQYHQHHVCGRCGYPFPNPHPSAKHRRTHKKHCGKIEGYIILDASGKTNGADEEDYSGEGGAEATSNSGYLPEDTPFQDHDIAVTAEQYVKDSESHKSVPLCKDAEGNYQGKSDNFSSEKAADGCSTLTNTNEVHNENNETDVFISVHQQQHSDLARDSSIAELQVDEMNENSGIDTPSNLTENAVGIHEVLPDSKDIEASHAGEESTEDSFLNENANISLKTMQLEKNDESHDTENDIATKMLRDDEFLHDRENFGNSLVGGVVSESSLPDRTKANNNVDVMINESSEAEEFTCTYPEADSFELDAVPTEPETLEEDVLLKVEQIMPENKVTEPNMLVQARQLATHEDIEAHGGNDLDTIDENRGMTHAVDNLEPTYTSSEPADTNYKNSYPRTTAKKSAPDEVDDHKSVKETFKAHIVEIDTKISTSESSVYEITNEEFQQHEEEVCTIPDETDGEEHLHGESKEDSDLSSNNPVMKSNFCIVESEIEDEDAAMPRNKNPNSKVTIQTDEDKECVLDRSIIPDTSKTVRTLEETNIGVSEQSLTKEVFLAKDQELDVAVVISDTSVDTSSQSGSVEGQWGSVSDVSHGHRNLQNGSRGETEIHNQDELHIEITSNTSNKEPYSEIEMSQKPHKIAEVNNRDEDIITKVVKWDSGNSHTPLRNLLVQATRESKQKAGNFTTLPVPTPTTNAQKTKAQASTGSPARKVDDHGEWSSPARLPVRKNDRRFKAKSSWVPFICCPSLN